MAQKTDLNVSPYYDDFDTTIIFIEFFSDLAVQ